MSQKKEEYASEIKAYEFKIITLNEETILKFDALAKGLGLTTLISKARWINGKRELLHVLRVDDGKIVPGYRRPK